PLGRGDPEHGVGAETGNHPAFPAGSADGTVMVERIARRIGRREHFDVEALEQRPRQELGGRELLRDLVVDARGCLTRQAVADAEDLVQLVIEPGAGGRAAEQVVLVGEPLPDFARICLDGCAPPARPAPPVPARHTERFERNAASIQHAQDVVVGLDDQRGGLRKPLVPRQDTRVHVAVGGHDRQRPGLVVQLARDAPDGRIGIEKAVRFEDGGHGLHDRRPTGGVLPHPGLHRLLVARDVPRGRVDAQRAPGRLRDVAEVAEQHALRALLDRLVQRGAAADRVHEIGDVQRGHVVVRTGVEAVHVLRGQRLPGDLVVEVVHSVAVTVHDDAARGAEDGGAALAAEGGQAVAALSLPDDGLPARELEAGFLGVGELPIVGEVIATADRGDARGVAHGQRPAGDVDLVRAVVADLAGAPAPEPMPVVMDDIVVVRSVGRRALPQLVVQVGRDGRHFPAADRGASVGIPRACEVGLPDRTLPDRLDDLDRARRGALLSPHLHHALVLLLRLDQQLAFARVVPTRLFHVDMLAGLHGEQRRRRVPMVGRGDHERVHVFVLERLAEVAQAFGSFALSAGDGGDALGEHQRIDVAHVGHFGVGRPGEGARQDRAAAVQAHDRDPDCVARRGEPGGEPWGGRETQARGRSRLQEFAAFHRSRTLMLRKYTSSPWSCNTMCPLRRSAKPGIERYLLLARADSIAAVQSSNSTIFAPFNQCSPWLPRNTIFDSFHCPTGRSRLLALGATSSYRAPARCDGILPSTCRSSSSIWYSNPRAEWFGVMMPLAIASGVIALPWYLDSSSETLYLTPLFAPGVTFHSQVSSKSPNVSTVIRSPPFRGRPSGTLGTLPVAFFFIVP